MLIINRRRVLMGAALLLVVLIVAAIAGFIFYGRNSKSQTNNNSTSEYVPTSPAPVNPPPTSSKPVVAEPSPTTQPPHTNPPRPAQTKFNTTESRYLELYEIFSQLDKPAVPRRRFVYKRQALCLRQGALARPVEVHHDGVCNPSPAFPWLGLLGRRRRTDVGCCFLSFREYGPWRSRNWTCAKFVACPLGRFIFLERFFLASGFFRLLLTSGRRAPVL